MADESAEKSVAAKLLLREGGRAWVSDPARADLLGPLPDGATVAASPASADVALLVVESAADVRAALAANATDLATAAAFWVAYPKGNRADVNRDSLWPLLAEHGFRPISQVALDDTWSALRFRPLRPGEPQFNPGGG
jgi:hypothetical protein